MAEFPDELRRFLGAQSNAISISLVNSAVLNAKVAHAPDEYLKTSTHTVYASPEFRRRRRLSFVALEGTQDDAAVEWLAQLSLLFRLEDGTALAYVQFLVEDARGVALARQRIPWLVLRRVDVVGVAAHGHMRARRGCKRGVRRVTGAQPRRVQRHQAVCEVFDSLRRGVAARLRRHGGF